MCPHHRTTDALEILGAATAPTAAAIADAVWDEATAGHVAAADRLDVAALVQARQQGVVLGDVVRDLTRTGLNGRGDDVAHIWKCHDENSI